MFCSQLGYYIGGKAIQLLLKEQARERVLMNAPDSSLLAIELEGNDNYIVWEEQDREFTYKGHLYDVVRIKKINNRAVYFCIDDSHEDALVNKLNDITKSNQHPVGKTTGMPGVTLVYNQEAIRVECHAPFSPEPVYNCIEFDDALQRSFASIIVPPPRA